VIADELRCRFAARLVGQVRELGAGLLLHENRENVILALRAGAPHLERRVGGLRSGYEVLHRLVGQRRVVPEHELVHRDHRDGGEVAPVERYLGGKRQHVDQRIGDEDLVRVALARLHVHQRFRTGRAALERDDHRLLHQIVLLDRRLHHSRHLIGRSPGARGNDDLDGLGRLPRDCGDARQRDRQCGRSSAQVVAHLPILLQG
jgi:hypothetical protein